MSITRITTPLPLVQTAATPASARAGQPRTAFELPPVKDEATRTPASGTGRPTQAAGGLETLLAVQGLGREAPRDDQKERRRRAVARGTTALDLLDDIKVGLLAGDSMPAALLKLRALTSESLAPTGEGGLDDVLAQIDLRVQVELAKREARS